MLRKNSSPFLFLVSKLKFMVALIVIGAIVSCSDDASIQGDEDAANGRIAALNNFIPPTPTNPHWGTFTPYQTSRMLRIFNEVDLYDGKIDDLMYYNYERAIVDEIESQVASQFSTLTFDKSLFVDQVASTFYNQTTSTYPTSGIWDASVLPGATDILNAEQLRCFNRLFHGYQATPTTIAIANVNFGTAQGMAKNSPILTHEEKTEVIALMVICNEFVKAYIQNLPALQATVISTSTSAGGRVAASCNIDWKGIWWGAVAGGFVGGVRGGIIGGTTGSFVAPVLGTVTGGVGGAVAGFAGGFVGGAGTGLATEVIRKCLLKGKHTTQNPPVSCNRYEYVQSRPTTCLIEGAQRKHWTRL